MPDLDGYTLDEARELLPGTGFGVELFGSATVGPPGHPDVDRIVRQSPAPGELVPQGT